MTSRAVVRRKTGFMVQNEDNGLEVPEWEIVHATVPFRLGGSGTPGSDGSRRQDVAGVQVQTAIRTGHFPASINGLQDGDWIDVVSGENAGRAFSIVEVDWKDQATARRVPLLAQDRPEEWP